MTIPLLKINATVDAYPLGRPADRDRYGMSPGQAAIYRWLVNNRPHDEPFRINFREAGLLHGVSESRTHFLVTELVARGWLKPVTSSGGHSTYAFVEPIMHFKEPRGL